VLFQAVEGALARCMESRRPLSVLVMEAQALDPLGPGQAGPFLEAFARRVAGLLGEAGTLKAIAGRTFCAVLPEVDASLVRDVSERIMAGLAAGPLSASDGEWRASASLGAASLEPDFSGSPFRLVDRAHTALAMAKEAGPTGYWVYQDTAVREDD
jgi:GGDEF domain-containing protein